MSASASSEILRADYRPPAWTIPVVRLHFQLDTERTLVEAELELCPDPLQPLKPLELDGEGLELLEIHVNGQPLAPDLYVQDERGLRLPSVTQACKLRTRVAISPRANSALEGLYTSGDLLLTQCEAEGFRRITFFIDRPDVLSVYEVSLQADAERFPVLLANGNPLGRETLDNGQHVARWHDPFPKPSYLFAIAAGRMDHVSAPFTTAEGRQVSINIWCEPGFAPRCEFALGAALRAMRWDEQRFGRCYDLDVFNIVAAQDFTMGAMENKGLNIFNARYILADIDSATDADFEAVESVIGHEYFHNWSGNRVTVRDWFQLSLKEGFTVFRDQEFTSDLHSRAVKRIDDVRMLRARQFPEDAGAFAHPVRPERYREINNFYTATVYEKGAEVVRMLHTLLGEATFRAGCDLYFARHDGQAASVDAFLNAMREVSGRDLLQFERWYAQSGTPTVRIRDYFDATQQTWTLTIQQHTPGTPDQAEKQPLHLPLAYALYDAADQPLQAVPRGDVLHRPGLLELRAEEHVLRFEGLTERPLASFLQGLSAPARLDYDYSAAELARLIRIERDPLCRWDAVQQLATRVILHSQDDDSRALIDAFGALLQDRQIDPAFVALCMSLPDPGMLIDSTEQVDIATLLAARRHLLDQLAVAHQTLLAQRFAELDAQSPSSLDADAIAARRLKAACLQWLARVELDGQRAANLYARAQTLTDRLSALSALVHNDAPMAGEVLEHFAHRVEGDLLLTDKWLAIVATRPQADAVEHIQQLLSGPHWLARNPNRVRAVLGSFGRSNFDALHRADGSGYVLLCGRIPELDAINPQVAARQIGALEYWRKLDTQRRGVIEGELRRLQSLPLSNDMQEMLGRLLT